MSRFITAKLESDSESVSETDSEGNLKSDSGSE